MTMEKKFMMRAIELAKNSIDNHGGPFGAVIVKDGEIIAETSNSVTKDNDPTAHAEVNCIRQACKKLNTFMLDGCEIYASSEPCPMCFGAIYWAHIDKIYYAGTREDAAYGGFDDDFIYKEIAIPNEQRRTPSINILQPEGRSVFDKWNAKCDKIEY
ncbi:MAG: nucleoside deaminase [Bacteroidales bacterium]|nr:nucleoside deaminase [Bacteroidales bacterium]